MISPMNEHENEHTPPVLDTLIQNETGIEVHIAEAPLDCVALGAGAVLDRPDLAGTRREELSYL